MRPEDKPPDLHETVTPALRARQQAGLGGLKESPRAKERALATVFEL
jgi:hypothetical protein